jgi:CTP-dependent riboflavin kinase
MMDPEFTRRVNGNDCIRVGRQLRDLLNVEEGDYVQFEVKAVYEVDQNE